MVKKGIVADKDGSVMPFRDGYFQAAIDAMIKYIPQPLRNIFLSDASHLLDTMVIGAPIKDKKFTGADKDKFNRGPPWIITNLAEYYGFPKSKRHQFWVDFIKHEDSKWIYEDNRLYMIVAGFKENTALVTANDYIGDIKKLHVASIIKNYHVGVNKTKNQPELFNTIINEFGKMLPKNIYWLEDDLLFVKNLATAKFNVVYRQPDGFLSISDHELKENFGMKAIIKGNDWTPLENLIDHN